MGSSVTGSDIDTQARELYMQRLVCNDSGSSTLQALLQQQQSTRYLHRILPISVKTTPPFSTRPATECKDTDLPSYISIFSKRLSPKVWASQSQAQIHTTSGSASCSGRLAREAQKEAAIVAVDKLLRDRLDEFCQRRTAPIKKTRSSYLK